MEVLSGLSDKVSRGAVTEYQPIPLGMTPLDRTLGGGIRSGELMLIGGAQGTGKTTMALQIARNIAQSGQANALYICFEHDEEYLLGRMMAMESALAGRQCRPTHQNRNQDPGCAARGTRAHGWRKAARRLRSARQSALAAGARAHQPVWPGPLPVARLERSIRHRRTCACWSRAIAVRRRRGRWWSLSTISSACPSCPTHRPRRRK